MVKISAMRSTATHIARKLQAAGFQAFFVGGCVRDSLLGREPQDFDIATDARPEDTERLFPHTIPGSFMSSVKSRKSSME